MKEIVKNLIEDDIINWTCDGVNEAISEMFKSKEGGKINDV